MLTTFSVLIISFVISLITLKVVLSNANGTFLNTFYVFFYTFQIFISFVLLLTNYDFELWNSYGTKLAECIPSFSFGIVIANISIMCAALLFRMINREQAYNILDIVEYVKEEYSISLISIFFLIGFSFTIISSLNISYVVAVFALAFSFAPVIIGLLWKNISSFHKLLWISMLIINLVFHSIQGSRGTAIFPICFVIGGYLISIQNNKDLFHKRLLAFGFTSILSIPFLSFIADYRDSIGRNEDVSIEALEAMIDFANDETILSNDKEDNSISRLLIHPNVAAIYLTPEIIPHREFDYLLEEMFSIITLSGEDGAETNKQFRSDLGYGTGVATRYGFTVNDKTSVEWPILADGYTRFGYLGIALYSFLFAIFLSWLEKKCMIVKNIQPLLAIVLLFFVLYNGVLSYMYSYYSFIKLLLFRMTLVLFTTYAFCKLTKRKHIA